MDEGIIRKKKEGKWSDKCLKKYANIEVILKKTAKDGTITLKYFNSRYHEAHLKELEEEEEEEKMNKELTIDEINDIIIDLNTNKDENDLKEKQQNKTKKNAKRKKVKQKKTKVIATELSETKV